MLITSENSVFTSLHQDGPMAVSDSVFIANRFSPQTKTWVKNLSTHKVHVTKYRALRSQIFEFLGIHSFEEIPGLIEDKALQETRRARAYALVANMFGIEGSITEIEARVHDYARTADAVINSLKTKILAPYKSHIAITNEIEVTNDPVQLLLIMFNNRYHQKARFEAKRKLMLMGLAGSIDQRERETETEEKFSHFLHFLNDYVWSSSQKIGEHDVVYLLSEHNKENFTCEHVKVISPKEAKTVETGNGIKKTLLKRRRFTTGNKDIPIYVSIRKKPSEAKVLKLLRKNAKNPATAVDDDLGLMAVLDSVAEVKIFQQHLTQSASKANSLMVLEDISDTLTGCSQYKSQSIGSSSKTPMLKFFARLGGMRVEFIIHTNKSWLNYMFQEDVAHDEYEVKRIFDSGVVELLFPKQIYHLKHATIRNDMIGLFRKQIEE